MAVDNCQICNAEFGIFRWRHECSGCGKTTCADCAERIIMLPARMKAGDYTRYEVCVQCHDTARQEINSDPLLQGQRTAYEAGYKKGFADGKREGHSEGYDEGYEAGQNQ